MIIGEKMLVTIRKFDKSDINNKVKWINDSANNKFLHYDIPIEVSKTEKWYDLNSKRRDRFDAIIEYNGIPCGITGLLSIDTRNKKAEYYIVMGERSLKGKGIATEATKLILEYSFFELNLNKVYLFTEIDNILAQKLFYKVGFKKEGYLHQDLFHNGKYLDRFVYGITKSDFLKVR